MPKVIHIEFKRRRPERFIVYMDDGEGHTFSPETVLRHSITIDREFDTLQFAEILREDGILRSKDQLLIYLSRRAHSRRELFIKALRKGLDADHINTALDELERLNLVNDRQFAAQYIHDEMLLRPCGVNLLKDKLSKRGISREIYQPILDEYFSDAAGNDIAREIMEKFLARNQRLPRQKRLEKLLRHLQSKGFEWDQIQDALESARLLTEASEE